MTGSRKWFVYTTDRGNDFAIELDESNTESVNGSVGDYTTATRNIVYSVPKNLKPRYLVYTDPLGLREIKAVALTATIYNGALANVATITDPYDTSQTPGSLLLVRQRAEEINLPKPDDTSLIDGDAS